MIQTVNESDIPYEEDDFVDAESIALRMKAMGHLATQIASLDVDSIEYVSFFLFLIYYQYPIKKY